MIDFESNEILDTNIFFGSEKLLSYKKAIRKLGYNLDCSPSSLEATKNIVDGFKQNGGSLLDIFELRIFVLECFINLMNDFDFSHDEDLIEAVEEEFGQVFGDLKKSGKELFDHYLPRFREIMKTARRGEFCPDTLEYYWEKIVGKF